MELNLLSVPGIPIRLATNSTQWNLDTTNYDWIKIFCSTLAAISLCFLFGAMIHTRVPPALRDLTRHVSFVSLHLADYLTNLLVMAIVVKEKHFVFLSLLLTAHLLIGAFCIYTAFTSLEWRKWSVNPALSCIYIVVVLGLFQGIQLLLAQEDYRQRVERRRRAEQGEDDLEVPTTAPARFHCKAIDGLLEGSVFAFVAVYAILKQYWNDPEFDPVTLTQWEINCFYVSFCFNIATAGLGLMEVDHRVSITVQRSLDQSAFAQARHLVFRAMEFTLRLLTVLTLLTFMRPSKWLFYFVACPLIAIDYLGGVFLLNILGGRDPFKKSATFLMGLPLFMVNIMQFVDAPGMTLQARRISRWILPIRFLEMLGVFIFCYYDSQLLYNTGPQYISAAIFNQTLSPSYQKLPQSCDAGSMKMWQFLMCFHSDWVVFSVVSGLTYYCLLFCYALQMEPGADLHMAVAYGDIKRLEELLRGSQLVLDISRYGPDGRNPLHLAAVQGQVACMKLLVEEGANLEARTNNRFRNTALHLAAMNKGPGATRYLCRVISQTGNTTLLNAANADGDTPLHIAAKAQNVSVLLELLQQPGIDAKIMNKRGLSPVECAHMDKFGFDRNSAESQIQDLFRQAEAGELQKEGAPPLASLELPQARMLNGSTSPTANHAASMASSSTRPASSTASSRNLTPAATTRIGESFGGERSFMDPEAPDVEEVPEPETEYVADPSRHGVPVVTMSPEAEEDFMKRTQTVGSISAKQAPPVVTNCGISSFMLSAGLGAVSRAFLGSIKEDEEDVPGAEEQPSVKANVQDFEEEKLLGEGAFGKVFLVRHKASREKFAMKIMNKAKFKAQKITSKAVSEQFILKTTRHRFIVSLHYAFQGTDFWALVMDYCPNGDLQGFLMKYGNPGLAFKDTARYLGEVLLALEHLHSIRVIFRDLKLENVIIDQEWRARVTDFGLAKKLSAGNEAKTMCGSYGYAAPEIMAHTGKYTMAVDLYSYGVMLYMMASGGELTTKAPPQRLPPMKHTTLKRKIRDAEKEGTLPWAKEMQCMSLLKILTADDAKERTSCTEVKGHPFYAKHLGHEVDQLMELPGPYAPPPQPPTSASS